MGRKYARRFPRNTNPQPRAPTQSQGQADSDYIKSVRWDLWELFKRVWALENGTGGPSGGVVSITATTPIVVAPSPIINTGVVSHANSGVTAATYGDASNVPVLTINATGHVTAATTTPAAGGGGGGGGTGFFWALTLGGN